VSTAGLPLQYGAGTCILVENVHAWLCRDAVGFYAIDAHCTHLGCLVRLAEAGFLCPCHHSHFGAAGEHISGPAPQGLRYLYVDLDASGRLIIRRDRAADPNDRLIA
jgi:Rieske Fe-S protein